PLFGKEQRKPREVGALLIDLDLREIGVVREIERETGGYAVLDLAPELSAAPSLRVNRVVPFHPGEGVGRRRPHPAGGALHALERAGQRRGLARQPAAAAFAFVDDRRVVLDPRRRGGEDEAVLPIMIGIE